MRSEEPPIENTPPTITSHSGAIEKRLIRDVQWDWNLETDALWWSDEFYPLFGYRPSEVEPDSRSWTSRIHPDDRDRVVEEVNAVIRVGGRHWSGEYRFLRSDGTYAYVFDRSFTVLEDGRAVRLMGALQDITENVLYQRKIEESEERMRFALQSADIGTWDLDPVRGMLDFDHRTRAAFGFPEEKTIHYSRTWDYVHPDDRERVNGLIRQALDPASGGFYEAEFRTYQPDESKFRWLRCRGKAYFDEKGVAYRFAGTCLDITEVRRKDEALRNVELRFQIAFDNASVGIALTDFGGNLLLINQAFCRMTGYPMDELMNANFSLFTHPDDLPRNRELLAGLMTEGNTSFSYDKRYIRKDGTLLWVNIHTTIIEDAAGRKDCYFTIIRDLTDQLKLREEQLKLRILVENSVELMSILELDGKNSYLNKAGRDMLGFDTEQEVLDTPISELHRAEDFEQVSREVLPAVMNEGRWSGTMLVRHRKTGEVFPVNNHTHRIDDPNTGQPIAVGAVMRDLRPELAARQALVESEKRFRSMILQAPVAMGLLRGSDLVIESANDPVLLLWGKDPSIIGLPLLRALPEIEGQGFKELLEGVMASGESFYGYETVALLVRNGRLEECFFNFVFAPVREADGIVSGVMVIATEVTQQVRARRELEESEKRFRNLILDAPMATAVYVGREMRIQLANEAMLTLWGKDASVIGKTLKEGIPELEGQPFLHLLEEVFATGVAYQGKEDRADLIVDGELRTFYFNFTYKPLRNADGEVYAILNMAVDITYQVNAKRQLMEVEENLREAINLAELGTWTIHPRTGVVDCSDRVLQWLGLSENPVTTDAVNRSFHENDLERVQQAFLAAMDPASPGTVNLEYTLVNRSSGREQVMHTQARVLFNEQGEPVEIRGTSQDITARRMTEQGLEREVQRRTEELNQANRILRQTNDNLQQFAYAASHDLQEPLRKIQSFSDLLEAQYGQQLSSDGFRLVQRMNSAAERMSRLIKDLLAFSRLTTQQDEYGPVDLNPLINDVIMDLEIQIQEVNAVVEVSPLPRVWGNGRQLTQLLQNLLTNALKYRVPDRAPRIRVAGRIPDLTEIRELPELDPNRSYVVVEIADNGIGFDEKYLNRIFQMFQRLYNKDQYEGTGIGLALCRKVVENHQGHITARSTPGVGSTFQVYLPVRL
ncbi:PAS domain S-box protein [Larkinella soli]|uniref:PAS domain S-box protein n=1 Tax=Larkinella soli TaxID=1770527 RepID=UPI000FFC5CD1|nr:PAS domain S-box protein [Larkinella soli]